MSIVQGGTYSYEHKGEAINVNDKIIYSPAVCESIALDAYVARTNTDLITGDLNNTCARANKVLTADQMTISGNVTKAGKTLVNATAGGFAGVVVGSKITHTLTAGPNTVTVLTVTDVVSETILMVAESGTLGVGTCTFQNPIFKDVYPGATLVHATGGVTLYVESKTSDYVVVTTTDGVIASAVLTSYKNVESLINYKSDDSKGTIYGVAMESFAVTSATAYSATDFKVIPVKWLGDYDKTKATTSDYATAGTVPESIHRKAVRLVHNPIIRQY